VIRKRIAMALKGQLRELLATVCKEREAPARVGAKRKRVDEASKGLAKVREMARDGAYSKAIRRLEGVEIAKYSDDEALAWARQLIPRAPDDALGLGVTGVTAAEREAWGQLKTCADGIRRVKNSAEPAEPEEPVDGDEQEDGQPKTEKKEGGQARRVRGGGKVCGAVGPGPLRLEGGALP
jgi:hypothetical protein